MVGCASRPEDTKSRVLIGVPEKCALGHIEIDWHHEGEDQNYDRDKKELTN